MRLVALCVFLLYLAPFNCYDISWLPLCNFKFLVAFLNYIFHN